LHEETQTPHRVQPEVIDAFFSTTLIELNGHDLMHIPHPVHLSVFM
jgi:hypothetical protein